MLHFDPPLHLSEEDFDDLTDGHRLCNAVCGGGDLDHDDDDDDDEADGGGGGGSDSKSTTTQTKLWHIAHTALTAILADRLCCCVTT